MQTTLPDLPFACAEAELHPEGFKSSSKATPRRYPRTDLKNLVPWTSFPNDIHKAIQSATTHANLPFSTPFTINVLQKPRLVANEEMIRSHAVVSLDEAVEEVVRKLRVTGWFIPPGSGNIAIIGDPDYSWIMSRAADAQSHPKLIVEYKTWWATDLERVVNAFNGICNDTISRQSLDALQQTYGYMTFNNNKFGILTNWQQALFLRRAETPDRKTLEYYIIENRPGQTISMLKAWVGTVLLAEADWFYASPTISSGPPGRNLGLSPSAWKERKKAIENAQGYRMLPVNGTRYECLSLNFRLCCFDLSSSRRGARGCVVNTQFLAPNPLASRQQVVCKVVDVIRYRDTADLLDGEACAYAALQGLQGKVIPTLYGFYEVWGILRLLALEYVGDTIPEDEQISQSLRKKMKTALRYIHKAGFVHGDIARRNFCRTKRGGIFLVDLERCQRFGNPSEPENEMDEVDRL